MNALTETQPVSAATLEHVLGTGDLSKLSTQQRVQYYAKTCESLGLNPLTRPFRFLALNGQVQLYATKDCTDQLRKVHGITLHVVDRQLDDELFIVTVRARGKDGREDEDVGAVTLGGLRGESKANGIMKATTKAKRRVTLSICGLGMTDEAELDTMPGAAVFDAEDEMPVAPIRAAASTRRGDRKVDPTVYDAPLPRMAEEKPLPDYTDAQWDAWIAKLRSAAAVVSRRQELVEMADPKRMVGKALATGPDWVRREISAILAESYARFPDEEPPADEALEEVAIAGEEKIMSGDD
jgi:hypothetical protein